MPLNPDLIKSLTDYVKQQPNYKAISVPSTAAPRQTGPLVSATKARELEATAGVAIDDEVTLESVKALVTWDNALKPRKYQWEGIEFLRRRKRAFICDAAGLGKMLQCAYASEPPVLVACPGYLTSTWEAWLQRYGAPHWRIIRVGEGSRAERQFNLDTPAEFHIINIEMMQRRKARGKDSFLEYNFGNHRTLIVDEAHHLRGRHSSQSKGAFALADTAEYVFMATATPIYNTIIDMYMQYRIIDPANFPSFWSYIEQFCEVLPTPFGPKIIGIKPAIKRSGVLRRMFEKYSITRSYAQVGMQLPKLQEIDIRIELAPAARERYDTLRFEFRDKLTGTIHDNLSAVLHALRKQTAASKLERLLEILTDTDGLSGTVVFVYYKETANLLAQLLGCPAITGDMAPDLRKRTMLAENFVVATIDSLSEGIDASHMHSVVFFEESTVPGQMYQALSRVRRFGQAAEMVRAYYIYAERTIDEVVHKTGPHKAADIKSIIAEALA